MPDPTNNVPVIIAENGNKSADITIISTSHQPFAIDTANGPAILPAHYEIHIHASLENHGVGVPPDAVVNVAFLDPATHQKIYGYREDSVKSTVHVVDFVHAMDYKKPDGHVVQVAPSEKSPETAALLRQVLENAFANNSFTPYEAAHLGTFTGVVQTELYQGGLAAGAANIRNMANVGDTMPLRLR